MSFVNDINNKIYLSHINMADFTEHSTSVVPLILQLLRLDSFWFAAIREGTIT